MNKKILFLDLDGTLLNDQKEITAGNQEALHNALRNGHRVVIATGRPLISAIAQAKRLGIAEKGCYVIAYNGGVVYDLFNKTPLFEHSLPLPTAKKVLAMCDQIGVYVQAYDETCVLVEPKNENENLYRYCRIIGMEYQVVKDLQTGLTRNTPKLLAIDFENRQPLLQLEEWISSQLNEEADCFFSNPHFLEIVPKGMNKGNAIRRVCHILGIEIADAIACGDAANDLAMLSAAGIGVAMANATDEVKKVADYITLRDNNHDGIAEVVELFCK